MRLGELIDVLEKHRSNQSVRFSDGTYPRAFDSWRGVYKWLTLKPGREHMAVGDLLRMAKEADGGTFAGYKGGEFLMDRESPLWADDYGRCEHFAIVAWYVNDEEELILQRENIESYMDFPL
jgi:hypothetical protein